MIYNKRIPPDGPIRGLLLASAGLTGLFGWVFGVMGALDGSIPWWQRVLLFGLLAVLMGTMIAGWLARMSIIVQVDDENVSASLWPLSKTAVSLSDIEHVERVTIDPLNDYGGWGIKGSKEDRLYGMSGIDGVRIRHSGGQLTILVDQPQELLDILEAEVPAPS